MNSSFRITSETQLSEAVLQILSRTSGGQASYPQLIFEIPKVIDLTVADKSPSMKRPLEQMWEQRVRNIRSHQGAAGNYITNGLLKGVKGGLRITDAGMRHVERKA